MNIGILAEPGIKYTCFRLQSNIIEPYDFKKNECYLISTDKSFYGKTIYLQFRIKERYKLIVDEAINSQLSRYRLVTGIILNSQDLLRFSAYISFVKGLGEIEVQTEYKGIPILMSRMLQSGNIQVCTEPSGANII